MNNQKQNSETDDLCSTESVESKGITTSDTLQTFKFDLITVRTVDRDGEVWFVAPDVCAALDILNPTNALKRLDEDEQALYSIKGLTRGNDRVSIVNESGLYSLILGSRKAQAKKFKKWVTAEVLPSIRKTGSYDAIAQPAERQSLLPDASFDEDRLRNLIRSELAGSATMNGNLLPMEQAKEIMVRMDRLGKLFHPFSDQFGDVLGVTRALRGLHPKLGIQEPSYRKVIDTDLLEKSDQRSQLMAKTR